MIEEWLKSYNPRSDLELHNAKREIFQEIALSGLNRAGFFEHACFYGGTALRIFYNLDRFSEDLDFSLLEKKLDFSLADYIPYIENEFATLGLSATTRIKEKKNFSPVESAFLKDNTNWFQLDIGFTNNSQKKIKIKIEVDRDPPLNFKTESKLLVKPYTQYINCMIKDHLFAGKMHAVLFRAWVNNEKGRDWYDLVWYIKMDSSLGLQHFNARAQQSGHLIDGNYFNDKSLKEALHNRIEKMNFEMAQKDIARFVYNKREIDIWSKDYFHQLTDHLVVKDVKYTSS
jgi:predicted nucleotidyltransferase component of viral defense system